MEFQNLTRVIQRIEFFEKKHGSPSGDKCYGMGSALKKYLDIPEFIPLKVEMDHGVYMVNEPNQCQLKTKYPIFVTRQAQKEELVKHGKQSYVMGSPFVHYRRLHNIAVSSDAQGTVFFPVHSTHLIDVIFDWENYAEQLLILPHYLQPVTVCMYWKDLLKGRHEFLEKKGIKVVTAGHVADPDFTRNFYHVLRVHKYSSSNLVSSCTFYSIEMDIPFFLYGNQPSFYNFGGDHNRPNGFFCPGRSELDEVLSFASLNLSNKINLPSQVKDICYQMIGLDDPIDKNSLRKIIFISLFKDITLQCLSQKINNKLHKLRVIVVNTVVKNNFYLLRFGLYKNNQVFTHLTTDEKILLHRTVKSLMGDRRSIIAVEIGSFLGASACFIANAISEESRLYCIDTWTNHNMKYSEEDTEEERDTHEEFSTNTRMYRKKISEIRKWSTEAVFDLQKRGITAIDFIFIDGDHSYEGVKKDWDLYSPLLKIGSVVAFHDTGWAEGVNRVIAESVANHTIKIAQLPNIQFFKVTNNVC